MQLMLRADQPAELVLATGEGHSVRELAETAFGYVDLHADRYVKGDFMLQQPVDYDLVGDPARAEAMLGWRAEVRFDDLARLMVDAALDEITST